MRPLGALPAPPARERVLYRLVLELRQGGPRKGQFLTKDLADFREVGLEALPVRRFQGGHEEPLLQLWIDRHP